MQNENRLIGKEADGVGKTTFMHVDPDTGKYTAWTIQITDAEADGRGE